MSNLLPIQESMYIPASAETLLTQDSCFVLGFTVIMKHKIMNIVCPMYKVGRFLQRVLKRKKKT